LGGERKAAEEFTQAVVLDLVRTGRISAGKGAELLHMTRHDFLDLMAAHDMSTIDYPPESLAHELEGVRRLLEKTAQP
jgi:predicted HTH domain antitoxin